MDNGTAATAPPSHSHHLDFPFVTRPPPTSHLMLIVASSPLHQQQRTDANTLTLSSPRKRATAPPPPPFNKILSMVPDYLRHAAVACGGGVRRWCAAVASEVAAAGSSGV